ncbi:unnamed protein product [Ranitomeya imitator]|uniref:Aminoglycoside phosphotransferase domain-containing protein n=1 Tax=Ranitomeya imitator TaxID=111125 RepID=A0ABN9L7I0_9NEOB|nr:unnamed protein product [Ranitomeya imitator]
MTSENETGNPQITSKPAVNEEQAINLVEALFGLKVSKVKPLPSYDDQNFYIQTWDDGNITQREYVLKILNGEDSKNSELVDVQTCAMKFLHDEGLPTPNALFTKSGAIMSLEAIDYGGVIQKHMVRLLTYLPGTPAAEITTTPEILFEVGKLAAILDEALTKKFQHSCKKSFDRGEFIWNLSNTPLLRKYTYAIKEENLRQKIEGVINQFENSVKQDLKIFRQCYISVIKMHFGTNLPAGRFGGRTANAPAILEDGGAHGEEGRTPGGLGKRLSMEFFNTYYGLVFMILEALGCRVAPPITNWLKESYKEKAPKRTKFHTTNNEGLQ